jgi:hypothetical protein
VPAAGAAGVSDTADVVVFAALAVAAAGAVSTGCDCASTAAVPAAVAAVGSASSTGSADSTTALAALVSNGLAGAAGVSARTATGPASKNSIAILEVARFIIFILLLNNQWHPLKTGLFFTCLTRITCTISKDQPTKMRGNTGATSRACHLFMALFMCLKTKNR